MRAHRTLVSVCVISLFIVLSALSSLSQETASTNPLAGKPEAIKEGNSLFRSNCSPCHGLNAKGGGRGPDLASGRWVHGGSDEAIYHTITTGVPGTDMPANDLPDSETWAIIAYLRSLAPAERVAPAGNAGKGSHLFWETLQCGRCHMVNGRGGILGPELSRVAAGRSDAYLIESIREPDKDLTHFPPDPNNHFGPTMVYDSVVVTTSNGDKIRGIDRNEDTFSIQLLDTEQHLRLFRKSELKDITHERKSVMPRYSEKMLNADDLQDLVAYLGTLRGDQDSK